MKPFPNRTNEEKLNIYTHLFGIFIFIPFGIFLFQNSNNLSDYLKEEYIIMLKCSILFCVITTILMFSFSIFRHLANPNALLAQKIDNIGVFCGVTGFYIPIITLSYILTNEHFWLIWITIGIAISGALYKLFISNKNSTILITIYLVLGWLAVSFIRNFVTILTDEAFWAIILSGIAWTIGGIIYTTKPFKYSHAIWHLSMVIGSFFMYLSIFSILNDHNF